VSYRLHPHARRVTSLPWVFERRLLLRLRGCSAASGRAAPSRVAQAEVGPANCGPRALCTRAEPALWAWATSHCATGPSAVSPSGSRISFPFSEYIQILANLKTCVRFI
jgi:hypothetical protein